MLERTFDLLFMIDATTSMQNVIQSVRIQALTIEQTLGDLYPNIVFRYGCICYRDPIDCKTDHHEVCDFNPTINPIINFLRHIKVNGGGDEPEDYVGAFNLALGLKWGLGFKAIVLIGDAPPHGNFFCGYSNYENQTRLLIDLIEQVAKRDICIKILSINGKLNAACKELKIIYENVHGPLFRWDSVNLNSDRFIENQNSLHVKSFYPLGSLRLERKLSPKRLSTKRRSSSISFKNFRLNEEKIVGEKFVQTVLEVCSSALIPYHRL